MFKTFKNKLIKDITGTENWLCAKILIGNTRETILIKNFCYTHNSIKVKFQYRHQQVLKSLKIKPLFIYNSRNCKEYLINF